MLVDFTTPIPSFKPTPSSVKKVDTKPKITSQITISEPVSSLPTNTKKPNQPIGNKNKIQKIKNTNFKIKTNRGYKLNSNDFIYGYINVDKRIAVIYDNGISYFYKLSKEFLDKYVDA